MKAGYTILFCFFTLCTTVPSQSTSNTIPDGYVALMRSDVQTKKVDIIRQNVTLTEDQAKTFWPLQRSYEEELAKLGDDRVNVIRDYAKSWDNMSDDTAKDLGTRMLDFQKKRVDLRKKYFERISKAITPTIAAKFFQVEIQLEDLIDLGIASAVPLVK